MFGEQIEKNEVGWACSTCWESRGVFRVLVVKPEEKRLLERPRHRCRDNSKVDLQEVGCKGMGFIDVSQDRGRCRALVNAAMNLRVP